MGVHRKIFKRGRGYFLVVNINFLAENPKLPTSKA
jgi:hypothetical protein